MVLASPAETFFFDFNEFLGLGAADRAGCGRVLAFIDISTDETAEFLFHSDLILSLTNSKLLLKNTFSR
jgi:hypothetical protein